MTNFLMKTKKYALVPATAVSSVALSVPAFASSSGTTATLTDTLKTFSDVFAWFLKQGSDLLTWMLDKPIILLSLSIFFVGAVVGMLSRIYNAF